MDCHDYVVVGAGIAGLSVAKSLSDLGADIVVLERHQRVGAEASTNNGGYVHAGGFHAASIADEHLALDTAQACIRGSERIRIDYPEAAIHAGGKIHLLFRDEQLAARAERRWKLGGINAKFVSRGALAQRYPALNLDPIVLGAVVDDFAIDTRLVFLKLVSQLATKKVKLLQSVERVEVKEDEVHYRILGHEEVIRCKKIIYCLGAGAVTPSMQRKLSTMASPRYFSIWKSHVLVGPELPKVGFMFVDDGEVSVTPQNGYSVICTRGDEYKISDPDYAVDQVVVAKNSAALCRALPGLAMMGRLHAHCCLKVSLGEGADAIRNVSFGAIEISGTELLAIPGKFTTAPILGDMVAQKLVSSGYGFNLVSRPGDRLLLGDRK